MLQWSYFIDSSADLWEAKLDLSVASRFYRRVLPWLNNEQQTTFPPQTSVQANSVQHFPAYHLGDALEQLFRIDVGSSTPAAEYKNQALSLEKMILYYDEAQPLPASLTTYDTGRHIPEEISGRVLMDSGEEAKLSGYIHIPETERDTLHQQLEFLNHHLEHKTFFALTQVQLRPQYDHSAQFNFLGVNPRYFSVDSFKGYDMHDEELLAEGLYITK